MKKQPLRGTTLTAAPDVLADRGEVHCARAASRRRWRSSSSWPGRTRGRNGPIASPMPMPAAPTLWPTRACSRRPRMVLENTLSAGADDPRAGALPDLADPPGPAPEGAGRRRSDCVNRLPAAEAGRVAELAAALALAVPARPETPAAALRRSTRGRAHGRHFTAWLQGKPSDEVDHLLARIPLRSPFGPLRLILKSLITPAEAAGKARGLLAMIPAGSMFVRCPCRGGGDAGRRSRRPARTLEPSCGRRSGPSWPKSAACRRPRPRC